MPLFRRIDIALTHAGKTRKQLADMLGISPSVFSNLNRRPGSTMRPENVAAVAAALKCDLHWLCTGEGGEYVPATSSRDAESARLARGVSEALHTLSESDRWRALATIALVLARETASEGPKGDPVN